MTRIEIHTYLAKKVEAAWTAYEEAMLQRPARSVFAKAAEIDAARTCFEELVLNAKAYPDDLLEYLLRFDDPLEAMREQWIQEQNAACSRPSSTPFGACGNTAPSRKPFPPQAV